MRIVAFGAVAIAAFAPAAAGAAELPPVPQSGARSYATSGGSYATSAERLVPLVRRGDPAAETMLGFYYAHGLGVPQSYEVAVDLYHRAAEQGDARGQYLLGLMYDKGLGINQDFILAYKWLDLATARASRRDRENFAKIRNAVAFKLTLAQIAIAQRLAVDWVPQPPQ